MKTLVFCLSLVIASCTSTSAHPHDIPSSKKSSNFFIDLPEAVCKPFIESVITSVVKVWGTTIEDGKAVTAQCSGVVLSPKQVATAKHCVGKAKRMTIDAGGLIIQVKNAKVSKHHDIAILALANNLPKGFENAYLAPEADAGMGWITGYGCDPKTRLQRPVFFSIKEDEKHTAIAGCVCHGDSGGGLYESHGGLVGIVTNTSEDGIQGLAVPVRLLQELL